MTLSPGTTLDRYTLVALLGEGAQGSVWTATDPLHDGALRALKIIPLRLARGQDLERIRREARLLAKLDHPGLCRCHGLFEDLRHEVLGFAMDYVEGQPLSEAIASPRLTGAMRERVLLHVAEALAHVHERGAVHRDVKLDNVLLADAFFDEPEQTGRVKLVDFGVAALDGARQRLTATGHAVGTPPYMAPELIDPGTWGASESGPEADIFSFGVLGWKLFIGGHPTKLEDSAPIGAFLMAYRRAAEDGSWPPRMTARGAVRTLRRCLALHAQDRPASAAAVVSRLEEALGRSSRDRPSVTGEHAPPRGTPGDTRIMTNPDIDDERVSSDTMVVAGPPAGHPDYPDIDTEPSGPPSSVRRFVAGYVPDQVEESVGHGLPSVSEPDPVPTPDAAPERAQERLKGPKTSTVVAVCIVAAMVMGLGFWLLLGSGSSPLSPAAPENQPKEPPASTSASPTGVAKPPPTTPSAFARPSSVPATCKEPRDLCSEGCCPMARDCDGDCSTVLPDDEAFDLRLYGVFEHRNGKIQPLKGVSVCAFVYSARGCKDLSDGQAALRVTAKELQLPGLSFQVRKFVYGNVVSWGLAGFWAPLTRSTLCEGLTYSLDATDRHRHQPRVNDAGRSIQYIVFALDPPNGTARRCSWASAYLP